MERQKSIEAIRAACIAANPEIVELKFGCKVKLALRTGFHAAYLKKFDTNQFTFDGFQKLMSDKENGWIDIGEYYEKNNEWEIIGRPIRLADVLLVVEQIPNAYSRTAQFEINAKNICKRWDMRTDDLTQQSDETIVFIHSLLAV
jgi:hypothetical protein